MTTPSTPKNSVSSTFAFSELSETSAEALASPVPPPTPYDANIALLLGQCCMLTYTQYSDNIPFVGGTPNIDLSYLTGDPNTSDFKQTAAFTWHEPLGFGASSQSISAERTVMFGFALSSSNYNVIALRGTRTYDEWIDDFTALPTKYYLNQQHPFEPGDVHKGFYDIYAYGSSGDTPRPSGTLADQIQQAVINLPDKKLPLYITGHSLGAGLAVLCSLDMALNGAGKENPYSGGVTMYNLAGPAVAAGWAIGENKANPDTFIKYFNESVPNAYRIVHECDIVPIALPTMINIGSLASIAFGHVGTPVNFCAQSGSIADNHYCGTYLSYLSNSAGS